jgi:hypothetical protein
MLRKVHAKQVTLKDAIKSMPRLARVGGPCPCSRSVRWVVEDAGAAGRGGDLHP